MFVPFAVLSMNEPLRLDYLWAALCLLGAVQVIFRSTWRPARVGGKLLVEQPEAKSVSNPLTSSCRGLWRAPDHAKDAAARPARTCPSSVRSIRWYTSCLASGTCG